MTTPKEVLQFWFHDINPQLWFKKDADFDETLRKKFLDVHMSAHNAETYTWRDTPQGRLAEIIVLDQFSRNMFRDQKQSFTSDPIALVLAQEAVLQKADSTLDPVRKAFMYMPYMHSESVIIHEQALKLFAQPGLENNLDFEKMHFEILKKFGRYPHRNKILGRAPTAEETEFLKQPGTGF